MAKVTAEVAKAEVEKWLNRKKIPQSLRDKFDDAIEMLEEAIVEGNLVLSEDKNPAGETVLQFKQVLLFPFEEGGIHELVYKSRLTDTITRPYMKGVAIDDVEGRVNGLICALTGQAKGIIMGMDSVDKRIARSIAGFFM